MFHKLQSLDFPLFIAPILLCCIGLISIYSITGGGETDFFTRQIINLSIGLVLFFFIALYKRSDFEKSAIYLYLLGVVVLVLVLFSGTEVRGARAWLEIGGFRFEPLELIKFFLIMATAIVISKYGKMRKSHSLVASALILLVPVSLIIVGSEYGTVVVTVIAWLLMTMIYNFRVKFLLVLVLLAVLFCGLSWQFVLDDNQKERVTSFLNPEQDIRGSGYQSYQAKLAIGSGGILGKGVGESKQSLLKFLPEPHTDFIFAVTAEEWGFIGVSIMLGIMVMFWTRLIFLVQKLNFTTFQSLTIIGFWALFFTQSVINIGMNLGVLPITGIPLPFVSYGGSSLISSLIALGIVQHFVCQNKEKLKMVK